MSIEHFDEGVYASNYYSAHLDYRYPDRHLYAPPLFPAILEWTLILTGGKPHAVMWVNVVLGTALVAAIWWITKLIAGGGAALAAAALATFSDFLIQYSRVALTDTPVCLFMVLAVGCGLIALRDRNSLAAVGAALLTAAAWWTKYNGWLPLAILGAGLSGWVVFERPKRSEALPRIGLFAVIAVGAFLFWLPCLWGLQEFGGYAAVAKNHAGYVVGLDGWWDSFVLHWQIQGYNLHLLPNGFMAGAIAVQSRNNPKFSYWPMQTFWLLLFGFVLFTAIGLSGYFIPFFALLALVFRKKTFKQPIRLGFWILVAWFAGLLLATPLYRPYPRLLLPLWISLTIFSAVGLNFAICAKELEEEYRTLAYQIRRVGILSACLLFMITSGLKTPLYSPRNQFEEITTAVIKDIRGITGTTKQLDDLNAIIYVVGEPGLYYHLASREEIGFDYIAQPASNLGMLSPKANAPKVPTFLVLGPHAPQEMEMLAAQAGQAKLIQEFPYLPSDFVLLDDHAPADLEENRDEVVQLWQITQH